jgi:hypothetical protein
LPDSDIKCMPIYRAYKDYFEIGLGLAAAAKFIAEAAGIPIQMPDETN